MKTKLSALTLALLPLFSVSATQVNAPKFYDDSVIVVYKENISKTVKRSVRSSVGARISDFNRDEIDDRFKNLMDGRIASLKLKGKSVKQALEILNKNPAVAYAEPNYVWTEALVPSDPIFNDLWGLNNTGQAGGVEDADIDAVEAWDITTGSRDVIVAVIDGGVDYTHPDLVANMWQNPGEIAGDGIDNDGNGYIDDIYGIDTANGDTDPMDLGGHGTHVAGTIGAVGNNGVGVVGVNHEVTIIACKFLDNGTGSTAGAIECIDYLTGLKNNGVNIRASNNSWGGGGFSQALQDSITAGGEADILFIAAAGNAGADNDSAPSYPATYDNDIVVSVASTNRTDDGSGYSYGLTTVDLAAPGSAIVSTYLEDGYFSLSGTSMATPHVTGAAALVWSINPELSALEMKQLLMDTGDANAWAQGKTVSGKRLNAYNALEAADPEPGFIINVSQTNQEVTAGEATSFEFGLNPIAGFNEEITLSLENDSGLGTLSATTAMPGDSVTLDVITEEDTPWGQYNMTVTASSGDIEKEKTVGLYVLPQGLNTFPYDAVDTPIDTLPNEQDPDDFGIDSVISVVDDITSFGISASVDITHTWSGDLILTLISPMGTSEILRANSGGDEDDIVETYTTDAFNGEVATGDWTLNIVDTFNGDNGTLNAWGVEITGIGEVAPAAPRAAFSYIDESLTVAFTNESVDVNDDIVSHTWDFGDGMISSEASPTHTFPETGSYEVTLTTTDAEGLSGSVSQTVAVSSNTIDITVDRAMLSRFGSLRVDLSFSGTESPNVYVYRNGEIVWSGDNTGRYRDRVRRVSGSVFEYVICDDTDACSDPVVVTP
jgi:subtilisin-like proprotein convertase family protein